MISFGRSDGTDGMTKWRSSRKEKTTSWLFTRIGCAIQIKVHWSSVFVKKKYHFHMNDAGLPVPDKQPVVQYVVTLRYHTEEIATYFMFAIPQRRAPRRLQIKNTLVG